MRNEASQRNFGELPRQGIGGQEALVWQCNVIHVS
jgi:hypothetical protein